MLNRIAICGSPSSGKTTFTLKLAKMTVLKTKRPVIVVFAQDKGSPLNYATPIDTMGKSLGDVIVTPDVSYDEVCEGVCIPKNESQIGLLGFHLGESNQSYARYTDKQVRQVISHLDHMAETILFDCTSDYDTNIISKVAIEISNHLIVMGAADLQSFAYLQSSLPHIHKTSRQSKKLLLINDVKAFSGRSTLVEQLGGVDYVMPYDIELLEQSLEGRMLAAVKQQKRGKQNFNFWTNNIADEILTNRP